MIEDFLLGDNPFIGVSHLAQEKAREEAKVSTVKNKIKVLKAALNSGATGYTFSTHDSNLELLAAIKKEENLHIEDMNYYILVPYAQSYIRQANKAGAPALIQKIIAEIAKHPSRLIHALKGVMMIDPKIFASLFIEMNLSPYMKILPPKKVKAVLLHEVLTELIVSFDLIDLLKHIDHHVHNRLNLGFGIETRNIGQVYNWLRKNNYFPEYIMTPLNPLGYQMAPGKTQAEKAVKEAGGRSKIIAINILASGAVSFEDALKYMQSVKNSLYAVAVGTSKPWRAKENFAKITSALRQC
ncbi:MAG: hypothetical protein DRJ55_04120 [Thermoprotei archaeon]|nr:MAG: hypothetical protein DRJ55_04120 [Thermoprotei archaeon]